MALALLERELRAIAVLAEWIHVLAGLAVKIALEFVLGLLGPNGVVVTAAKSI